MSFVDEESAQLSGGGSHHEKLMHHAIDIFCSRPLRNLDAGLLRSTTLAVLLRFLVSVSLSCCVTFVWHCLVWSPNTRIACGKRLAIFESAPAAQLRFIGLHRLHVDCNRQLPFLTSCLLQHHALVK
jgi:hypothetical protein